MKRTNKPQCRLPLHVCCASRFFLSGATAFTTSLTLYAPHSPICIAVLEWARACARWPLHLMCVVTSCTTMLHRIPRLARCAPYPRRTPHRLPYIRAFVVKNGPSISDPIAGHPGEPSPSVLLDPHPADPATYFRTPLPYEPKQSTSAAISISSPPSPPPDAPNAGTTGAPSGPSPPVPSRAHINIAPTYSNPLFHTHRFVTALEKTFPTPTARSLMPATRALLVDRVGRVKREGLTVKDLENVRQRELDGSRCVLFLIS